MQSKLIIIYKNTEFKTTIQYNGELLHKRVLSSELNSSGIPVFPILFLILPILRFLWPMCQDFQFCRSSNFYPDIEYWIRNIGEIRTGILNGSEQSGVRWIGNIGERIGKIEIADKSGLLDKYIIWHKIAGHYSVYLIFFLLNTSNPTLMLICNWVEKHRRFSYIVPRACSNMYTYDWQCMHLTNFSNISRIGYHPCLLMCKEIQLCFNIKFIGKLRILCR